MSNGYSLVIDRSSIALKLLLFSGIGNFQYGLCLMAHSVAADRQHADSKCEFLFLS